MTVFFIFFIVIVILAIGVPVGIGLGISGILLSFYTESQSPLISIPQTIYSSGNSLSLRFKIMDLLFNSKQKLYR